MKNTFTLIGGSGFIGSRLIARLLKNNNIVNIDKNESTSFPEVTKIADVRFPESLKKSVKSNGPIINLAAEHKDNITPFNLYNDVNVEGASNVCDVARQKKLKL